MLLKVRILNAQATIPKLKNPGDAGFDLQAMEGTSLNPGESTVMPTGLAFKIPKGYYGQIKPRSSLAMAGLSIDRGIIDEGCTGEVRMILVNRNRLNNFDIATGDRVAQIIFIPVLNTPLVEVKQFQETKRGDKGFGSTGIYKTGTSGNKITETKHSIPTEEDKHSYRMGICLIESKDESKN